MKLDFHRARKMKPKGASIAEVLGAITILMPLGLICLDLAVVVLAYLLTGNLCQQLARSAADGPPAAMSLQTPRQRAQLLVSKYQGANSLFSVLPNIVVTETTEPSPDIDIFGGQIVGQVSVQITSRVIPPFDLTGGKVKTIYFTSTKTCPFTCTVARTTAIR